MIPYKTNCICTNGRIFFRKTLRSFNTQHRGVVYTGTQKSFPFVTFFPPFGRDRLRIDPNDGGKLVDCFRHVMVYI